VTIASNAAIAIARVLMSSSMIYYGASKLIDITIFTTHPTTKAFMSMVAGGAAAPLWFAYLNAGFQTLCGILVLLGAHSRKAAWGMVVWLAVLTVVGHAFWNMTGENRIANLSLFFRNLGLIAAFLMVAAVGPGSLSVDGARGEGARRR
jgi:putative oxidoreductase